VRDGAGEWGVGEVGNLIIQIIKNNLSFLD